MRRRRAERRRTPSRGRDSSAQEELEIWHLPEVDWPVADRLVRVVKTVRVQNANRVVVRKQDGQPIKEKKPAPIVSTNFYATNVDLGAIPPQFLRRLREFTHLCFPKLTQAF